ncbi:MAG: hypothetical protein Tsb0014_42180 [Pleurocapsa sp.]
MKLSTKIVAIAILIIALIGGVYYWSLERKLNKRFSENLYENTTFPSSYINQKYGIKLNYPSDWQLIQGDSSNEIVAKLIPKSGKLDSSSNEVIIASQLLDKSMSLDEYTTENVYKITKTSGQAKILDSQVITLNNNQAHQVIYTAQEDNKNLKYWQTWLLKNNRAYTITYKAKENSYDNFIKPVQETIVKSFEVEKVEPKTQPQ